MVVASPPRVTLESDQLRPYSGPSRRESPRLEVEAVLNSRLASGNLRLTLVDLGFGGFAVESPIGFEIGTQHVFRFSTNTDVTVTLRADAVYCRSTGTHDGMTHCVAGFKYVLERPEDERAVDILIDAANSPLTFL